MAQTYRNRVLNGLPWSLTIAIATAGCGVVDQAINPSTSPEPSLAPVPSPTAPAQRPSPEPPPVDAEALYNQALTQATSAVNIAQTARSPNDWELTVLRWEQAIATLQAIPAEAELYESAQTKITEYQQNLAAAQQRAAQTGRVPTGGGSDLTNVPSLRSRPDASETTPAPESAPGEPTPEASAEGDKPTPTPDSSPSWNDSSRPGQPSAAAQTSGRGQVYLAQIVRRAGGTPVIEVTFNGQHRFEMIVDTGASGTVITQSMATRMGVRPTGSAIISTASDESVTFPIGRVRSVEVNGATAQNLQVAIAPDTLEAGLLGNDFFRAYDVTFRQNVVEFRER